MGPLRSGAEPLTAASEQVEVLTCTRLRESDIARAVVNLIPEVLGLFFKRNPTSREILVFRMSFHFQPFSSRNGVCQGASEDGKQLQANHQPGGKSTCP